MINYQPDSYKSVSRSSSAVFKDRNSKFLAFAFPVSVLEEVNEILIDLKKKYHDASHHCFGYVLGASKEVSKAHDDGEPTHSAGDPILGQIRSKELSDTLVVVVRYFGGTKLGVGGLIQAYRTSAALALDENRIIAKKVIREVKIRFSYDQMNAVMRLVKELQLKIIYQSFELDCQMHLGVPPSKLPLLNSRLIEGRITIDTS